MLIDSCYTFFLYPSILVHQEVEFLLFHSFVGSILHTSAWPSVALMEIYVNDFKT